MKLEATSLPAQKTGPASGGKYRNTETANQEFSDALKSQTGSNDKAATERAKDTESKGNRGTETKNLIKSSNLAADQNENIKTEDVLPGTDMIEIPLVKQEGQPDIKVSTQNSLFLVNQALMEQLTASNIDKSGDQQSKIAIDDLRQSMNISRNLLLEQESATNMGLKAVPTSGTQQDGAVGKDILENMLKQKAINSQGTDIDADFKNLPTNPISREAAIASDQKRMDNTRILSELAAKQIFANTNSPSEKPSSNNHLHTQLATAKENVPVENAWLRTIGEAKTGEQRIGELKSADLKTGELKPADMKIGELKSADVKIGDVKLERVAPANLNQVIINALSSTGNTSPISTNVIIPAQISSPFQKTLTIQLHPQNLGVVEVKISHNNGNLSVSIETNTLVAEKILKAEISVLTEKLAMMGILHDEMTVRNNPGLEVVKDNNQERNGGMNSNLMGDGQSGPEGENNFERQLHESNFSEGKMKEADQIYSTPRETDNKRDGIYL